MIHIWPRSILKALEKFEVAHSMLSLHTISGYKMDNGHDHLEST